MSEEENKTIYGEKMKEHDCPLCFRGIPNDERRGEYIGALSRYDNETYVCSQCGSLEGMFEMGLNQNRHTEANKTKYRWQDWRKSVLDEQYRIEIDLGTLGKEKPFLAVKDESHRLPR